MIAKYMYVWVCCLAAHLLLVEAADDLCVEARPQEEMFDEQAAHDALHVTEASGERHRTDRERLDEAHLRGHRQ